MNSKNLHWRTIRTYTEVGYTRKTFGRAGFLYLVIRPPFLESVLSAGFLFLNLDGNMVPFAVEAYQDKGDLTVKFEGIDDPGAARPLVGTTVHLPADEVKKHNSANNAPGLAYQDLVGYLIQDRHAGEIGKILRIEQYPQQEMAIVSYQTSELLIPLVAKFIENIDRDTGILYTRLPEGLPGL